MVEDTKIQLPKKLWGEVVALVLCGLIACSAIYYLHFYGLYRESLQSNPVVGHRAEVTLGLWHLFSFLTILWAGIWIFIVAIRKGRFKEVLPAVWSVVVTLIVAAFVMPTIGRTYSSMYQNKANHVVNLALRSFNQTSGIDQLGGPFHLDDYTIEVREFIEQKPNIVEVRYELKKPMELNSFPKRFSVILNREDGSAELRKESVTKPM